MRALIKQARVIHPQSPFHGRVFDILIEDGVFKEISEKIEAENSDKVLQGQNLHISAGWVDLFADFAEPGFEYRETIESGARCAASGGFTDVLINPNTKPVTDTKSGVEFIKNRSHTLPINIFPLGCITKHGDGKELAEMYDMYFAGAKGFTDGHTPVQNPAILLKALQYVAANNAVIVQLPDTRSLSSTGLVNEGIMSTRLGLPGKAALAEELMIARDIELLRYTKSKLHITGISTAKGLALIQKAKAEGLNITCSVTPYHITLCDEDLINYDCNLKVNNPLRTKSDMEALRKAFVNGEIDSIAAHHSPQHSDNKDCEFEYAAYGMLGLQTSFSLLCNTGTQIETIVKTLTASREIFNLQPVQIAVDSPACITIFSPDEEWTYSATTNQSKSQNSPFLNKTLKGRVLGIFNKNTFYLND